MTKITSSKRNRDSSKVSMRETLNDAGNPTRGLLRPKNEGGGLLGEAHTWKSLQGVQQKQTYIQYGIACVHEQPPATAPGSRRQFGLYPQRSFVKGFFVHHKRVVQQVLRHLEKREPNR